MGKRCGNFARLSGSNDVLLGLHSGFNKVDVANKEALIKSHNFLYQVQADQPDDQFNLVNPLLNHMFLG